MIAIDLFIQGDAYPQGFIRADAVATANRLGPCLQQAGVVPTAALAQVQDDRAGLTRIIQRAQGVVQQTIVSRALSGKPFELPLPARIITSTPGLRTLPARFFALGVRQPVLTF